MSLYLRISSESSFWDIGFSSAAFLILSALAFTSLWFSLTVNGAGGGASVFAY